ncbi:5534_t:CDS:2, partial [Cetraspora pellucida]
QCKMPAQTFHPNAIFHSLSSLNDLTLPPLRFLSSPSTDDEQGTLSPIHEACLGSSPIQTTFDTLPFNEDTQYDITTPLRLLPLSQVSPLRSLTQMSQESIINQQTVNENKENSVGEYKRFSCEECGKIYQGKNARSILRRHLKDKHEIELPRASRWDNDPNRPKNDEERRQRMSAQKAREKRNLLKELEQKENKRVITHLQTNINVEQNYNMSQGSTPTTPPSRIDRTVVLSPNSRMNPYVVMRPLKSAISPCKGVSGGKS